MPKELIAVLDFGGQYSHLITRRIRECEVYSELVPYTTSAKDLLKLGAKGIVLSGGPASVYDEGAPKCDPEIFRLYIPVLGICYGLQLMAQMLGGQVRATHRHEYGKTLLEIKDRSDLFRGIKSNIVSWMSHGDYAETLPKDFDIIGSSENCATAAVRDHSRRLYGVQFHPEVAHTESGTAIIRNFVVGICGCSPSWNPHSIIETAVGQIRTEVGDQNVLTAVSGGVDSTTTAVLMQKAVGDRLACIFVNHGLLREGEAVTILNALREDLKLGVIYVDASKRFLDRLKGVKDPEEKRRVIG
jgi:GMP synthase (glutamine-hydrolysing)